MEFYNVIFNYNIQEYKESEISMTTGYIINIGNASAKQWAQVSFQKILNGMSSAVIALDGVSSVYASEFVVDNEIYIYKNGSLQFRGKIIDNTDLSGGGMILPALGIEIELTDEKAPMSSPTDTIRNWVSTSDNTIFTTLVTSVSGWSVDVSNSSSIVLPSFRATASESVWNSVIRLIEQTGKDIFVDQATKTLYLYDNLTRADKFVFIEGRNARNIERTTSRSIAGKVLVYGKGDGEFQIRGSFGSGTPVHLIIDRNIVTNDEADDRAESAYNKINPERKVYNFTPTLPLNDIVIGDSGLLQNNSARISDTVNIVKLKTTVDGNGTEKFNVEVTNPDFRVASKNDAENSVKRLSGDNQNNSSMQGSGNTLTFGQGINAQSGAPLKLSFNFDPDIVEDEVGVLHIDLFTIDYDVDPYNSQYGNATFTGTDPQVQNDSASTQPGVAGDSGNTAPSVAGDSGLTAPTVNGTSADDGTDAEADTGTTLASAVTITSSYVKFADVNPDTSQTAGVFINVTFGRVSQTDYPRLEVKVESSSGTTYASGWDAFVSTDDITEFTNANVAVFVPENSAAYTYDVYVRYATTVGNTSESNWIARTGWITLDRHSHGDGSYAAANHDHSDGSYAAVSHAHADGSYTADNHGHPNGTYDINAADLNHIAIGDGVSEAGSVNATEVDIYLDFWNGAAWINKHSVLNTGKTLDTGVDLSNGGVYPDVAGLWRVRVEPDSGSPDFIQAKINLKHNLDS